MGRTKYQLAFSRPTTGCDPVGFSCYLFQAAAVEILHREEGTPLVLVHLENLHEIGGWKLADQIHELVIVKQRRALGDRHREPTRRDTKGLGRLEGRFEYFECCVRFEAVQTERHKVKSIIEGRSKRNAANCDSIPNVAAYSRVARSN